MKIETLASQPSIPTDRLLLRPVRYSDAEALRKHTSDWRVAHMTRSIPHPLPEGEVEAFIAAACDPDRSEDIWVMDGSKSGLGPLMGIIGLERMDRDQSEIGYWVVPEHWGSGLATEAVAALVDANPLASKTIFGAVFQDNPASSKILENLDFKYIGEAEYFSAARGETVPTWTYVKTLNV